MWRTSFFGGDQNGINTMRAMKFGERIANTANARTYNLEKLQNDLVKPGPLSVRHPYDLGGLSHLEGTYFARISRYDEATQDYLDSLAAYDQGLCLQPEKIKILNDRAAAYR
jgi:hypothetical protein